MPAFSGLFLANCSATGHSSPAILLTPRMTVIQFTRKHVCSEFLEY